MRLARDLAIATASSGWTVVVSIIAIPIYLSRLGVEAYGLVGFVVTLQAVLQLLDLGIAPTINREVARKDSPGANHVADLLGALAAVTWLVALAIAAIVALASPWIAAHWLQARQLPEAELANAVVVAGFLIACRWPIALYQAVLMGGRRLSLASGINIIIVSMTHFGGIAVILLVEPSVVALFAWQSIVALLHVLVLRHHARRIVGPRFGPVRLGALSTVWRFSIGMGLVGITGLILSQMDKLLLSALLTLRDFGFYMLATSVIAGMAVFVMPVFNAAFPRLSRYMSSGDEADAVALYLSGTRLLASIIFPLAVLLAIQGEPLIRLWVGDAEVAARVAPVLALLALGSALHGVMHLPYAVQVASGRPQIPVCVNLVLMAFFLPALIVLTRLYGVVGAGLAWLAMHLLYLAVGFPATRKLLPDGTQSTWLWQGVAVPALIAGAYAMISSRLSHMLGLGSNAEFGLALALFACAVLAGLVLSNPLRTALRDYAGRLLPGRRVR